MFNFGARRRARTEALLMSSVVGFRRVWQAENGADPRCIQAVCNPCRDTLAGSWGGVSMTRAEAVGEHCRKCGRIW